MLGTGPNQEYKIKILLRHKLALQKEKTLMDTIMEGGYANGDGGRSDNTFSSNFVKVEMAKPYYLDKAIADKSFIIPSTIFKVWRPLFYLSQPTSCLTFSYAITLAATLALRLSVLPSIGILTLISAKSWISFLTPLASLPITITSLSLKFKL